jgi:hypothetical protein
MHHMPEKGARCYIAEATDGSGFVLIGYVNKSSYGAVTDETLGVTTDSVGSPELSYAYNKAFLEPGDHRVSTGDGNHLTLRRGGMVELAATPLAQLLMVPLENLVRLYAQRYQMRSTIGEIDWGHVSLTVDGVAQEGAAENTPVLVKYNIKETAQDDVSSDKHYRIEVRAGQLSDATLSKKKDHAHFFASPQLKNEQAPFAAALPDSGGVVSVNVFDDAGSSASFAFQVNGDGNLFVRAEANAHLEFNGWFYAHAADGIALHSDDVRLGKSVVDAGLDHVALAEKIASMLVVGGLAFKGVINMGGVTVPAIFFAATVQAEGAAALSPAPSLTVYTDIVDAIQSPSVRASKT